ncbi:peptidase M20 [Enteractinococcus helveticum]|uniref:Peptidase M20 domain-containing protein 2 n=2 Tax=Enteractinococcus helveticum TaxID=1837282 RepID=A0A1B7M1Z8_9MICC|nr:peptidase M20 [Enteractinococcus helveticum]
MAQRHALVELSRELHADPELGWAEYRSSERVSDVLKHAGFSVVRPYLGLETAFHAKAGAKAPSMRIGLMAEYDALPGLGHACGHNLIAASSVGAAIGLAQVAEELNIGVEVFGTPAEEGGGGKIDLLERGAFDGLDLAMMVHPGPVDVARASPLAVAHWAVQFTGKAAHAASFPTEGINAADAFTIAQVAIGLLRQHLPTTSRVHGVVLDAGTAPNSIPAFARGRWYVRAQTLEELHEIEKRVLACFEAAALATGCSFDWELESKPYAEFHHDEQALEFYSRNAESLGRVFQPDSPGAEMAAASTDMGNVSHIVPSIHPYIGLDSFPVLNHQQEFADHTIGPTAEKALLDGAIALAWTALDVATHRNLCTFSP